MSNKKLYVILGIGLILSLVSVAIHLRKNTGLDSAALQVLEVGALVTQSNGHVVTVSFDRERILGHQSDVQSRHVSDDVIPIIGKFKNLATLDLSRTHITDRGIPILCQLECLSALDISHTMCTDNGAARLIHNSRIAFLVVDASQVSTQLVRAMSVAPYLRVLLIDGEVCTDTAIALQRLRATEIVVYYGAKVR